MSLPRSARSAALALVLAALASTGCSNPTAPAFAATTSEWVSGPTDLRKVTAVIRVAPPAQLRATLDLMAAKAPDDDLGRFLHAHAEGGFGSGFVMVHRGANGARAFIVTNRHVVAGATEAEVSFGDGTTYKACEIVFVSAKNDLAVLALPESAVRAIGYGLSPRQAATTERDAVIAAGFPAVGDSPSYQVTDGKVSNARFTMPEAGFQETLVQHTAPIDPGSSGGPLTDDAGRLVGVNVALVRGRSSMFFAVPASAVVDTVREAHELTTHQTSTAWMKGSLEHACGTLSAELSSASSKLSGVSPFVSNKLVAEKGLESFVLMTKTAVGPKLRREFYADPIEAFRESVVFRLALRADFSGGASGSCTNVNPADEGSIAAGKPVRLSVRTARGDMKLSWTFEHGAWRVAGGDLLDAQSILAQAEPAAPSSSSSKPTKSVVTRSK